MNRTSEWEESKYEWVRAEWEVKGPMQPGIRVCLCQLETSRLLPHYWNAWGLPYYAELFKKLPEALHL
jgi:hypothetical protein